MKLKITILAIAAAALGASAAFASPPAGKGKPTTTPASTNAAAPSVMFVVRGTILSYVAANGGTNGSVQLKITASNHAAKSLQGQTPTFTVGSSTRVVEHKSATPAVGDKVLAKIRATKASAASLTSTGALLQLVDQGKPAS
jgi:hypothetical protein